MKCDFTCTHLHLTPQSPHKIFKKSPQEIFPVLDMLILIWPRKFTGKSDLFITSIRPMSLPQKSKNYHRSVQRNISRDLKKILRHRHRYLSCVINAQNKENCTFWYPSSDLDKNTRKTGDVQHFRLSYHFPGNKVFLHYKFQSVNPQEKMASCHTVVLVISLICIIARKT